MPASKPHGTYRRNHGRGHSYFIDDVPIQGVTTILGKGLPKTALYNWAGRESAREAVDNWEELSGLPVMERYERIAGAANATRDAAGVKGTRVHTLAERLVHGEAVDLPDDIAGRVRACAAFLDAYRVEPILTEFPVFSRAHMFGGSPDLLAMMDNPAELPDLDPALPKIIDWKTNRKGPYGDHSLQLAAYRWAQFYLAPDGHGGWVETPMPEVSATLTVWLREDGFDVYPMQSDESIFRDFLYVQQVARITIESRDWKGEALTPPARTKEPAA
jgi:hypothetical protein